MTITIYPNGCHPLPMRPGWKHWFQSGDLINTVYYRDDIDLRFTVTGTHERGSIVRLLKKDRAGSGWVGSEIRLPKFMEFGSFDDAMLGAEKLRDYLAKRSIAERLELFKTWQPKRPWE